MKLVLELFNRGTGILIFQRNWFSAYASRTLGQCFPEFTNIDKFENHGGSAVVKWVCAAFSMQRFRTCLWKTRSRRYP